MRLAGLDPVGAIAEVVAEDGSMMRLPGLIELGERDGVPVITIEQLIAYLDDAPEPDRRRGAARVPESSRVAFGRDLAPHRARRCSASSPTRTASPAPTTSRSSPAIPRGTEPALVRVHSECLTGEAFGSLKCECGPQLDAALDAIDQGGVVVYMRGHEGRGIGLINKLRAYSLQERGLDTVDANLALGLPADARDYAAAPAILADLGVEKVRLLTNNTDKVSQLERTASTSSSRCRCSSASAPTTTSTSPPSATAWATSSTSST